jgi:hypothetical protein
MAPSDESSSTSGESAPICRHCHYPVAQALHPYDVMECMHWVCFHYVFEHGEVDVDRACQDPSCPSRMVDPNPPVDWFTERGIES